MSIYDKRQHGMTSNTSKHRVLIVQDRRLTERSHPVRCIYQCTNKQDDHELAVQRKYCFSVGKIK